MENYFIKARDLQRINTNDVITKITDKYYFLHGDRQGSDDLAIVGALCSIDGYNVMIIGQNKGHDFKESQERNYAMSTPQSYKKASRLFKLAERFKIPVITLIDTPGAFPGKKSEEDGISYSISNSMYELVNLKTNVMAIVLSEGSSGGALALGVADKICMLEHAVYSILSPEGFASILFKDDKKVDEAIKLIKAKASDLYELKIIDKIINEDDTLNNIKKEILSFIKIKKPLYENRISKMRNIDKYGY